MILSLKECVCEDNPLELCMYKKVSSSPVSDAGSGGSGGHGGSGEDDGSGDANDPVHVTQHLGGKK